MDFDVKDPKQLDLAKQWMTYLATSPLGVKLIGDSKQPSSLLTSLEALQIKLKEKGIPLTLVSGSKIVNSPEPVKKAIEKSEEKPKEDKVVKEWKNYLKSKGLYSGDVESPVMDDSFKQAIILLEKKLSDIVPSVKGMMWQGKGVNPAVTPKEYEEALKLAETKKTEKTAMFKGATKKAVATATMDALGPPEAPEDRPSVIPSPLPDQGSKTYVPGESNHNGVTVNPVPVSGVKQNSKAKPVAKALPNLEVKTNIDDRMSNLADLLSK